MIYSVSCVVHNFLCYFDLSGMCLNYVIHLEASGFISININIKLKLKMTGPNLNLLI